MSESTTAIPDWVTALKKALSEHPRSVVFQLASVDRNCSQPFVRSHIFRDFLFPASNVSSPLLVTTTDVRTPKSTQLISNMRVQLVWWIDEAKEQYRVSGVACLVPSPTNHFHPLFKCVTETAPRASTIAELVTESFDWERKRKEIFTGLSGHMKATWCRPVPGTQLKDYEQSKTWPQSVEEPSHSDDSDPSTLQHWTAALENFALILIEPKEVDYLELGMVPNRRTRFRRQPDSSWESELLVP